MLSLSGASGEESSAAAARVSSPLTARRRARLAGGAAGGRSTGCARRRQSRAQSRSVSQYAVGTTSRQDKLLTAIRTFLASGAANEKRVVLSLDAKNAFNTISRQAILERVNNLFPALTEFFLQWYGEPSELWFAYEDRLIRTIDSAQGT